MTMMHSDYVRLETPHDRCPGIGGELTRRREDEQPWRRGRDDDRLGPPSIRISIWWIVGKGGSRVPSRRAARMRSSSDAHGDGGRPGIELE